MILNTLIAQPAQYMNSSFKKALSYMNGSKIDINEENLIKPVLEKEESIKAPLKNISNNDENENNSQNQSNQVNQVNQINHSSAYVEKDQIFEEIKSLLENF